ncbi:MAG: FAD-binding oxidoreductase [Proteobacteria bacterium]|nr:FAD-binding oxidoreductase [Pseudomonadota bacterium]
MSRHTLIIGGGGIGSATACFLSALAEPGERITVVERDPTYQGASSSLSASSIRQQFSTPVSVQLSQFGWDFMRSCVDEAGVPGGAVGLNERGYLFLGSAQQAEALRARADGNRRLGAAIEAFTPAALAARFPWLNTEGIAYAAQTTAGEGWFDGYLLQQWYRRRARERGVHYVKGDVARLVVERGRVLAAELADGSRIAADRVLNAGGAWSAALARSVGVDIPVRARRRTVLVVSCPQAIEDFPILIDVSGVFVRPEQQHFLVAVSPPPEQDLDDLPLDPDLGSFEDFVWPTLAERIPAFEALRVERAWAGYYEFNTVDHNGLVGQVGPSNFFLATGFSGHGLMHSAGVGRGMAELLTFGEYRSIDLSPLSPRRLQTGEFIVEDAVY